MTAHQKTLRQSGFRFLSCFFSLVYRPVCLHRLFCTTMRCDTSFGEEPQHAVLLLPMELRAPALCSRFYSPLKGRSQENGFKNGMLEHVGKRCVKEGPQSPPSRLHCSRAPTMGMSISEILLQRERCVCFTQSWMGAAWFLCARERGRRGGKLEHTCAVGRCRQQPWGLHGHWHLCHWLGLCTDMWRGFLSHTDWWVITGKVRWQGSCLSSCQCGCHLLGFAGRSLNVNRQNPNSCSCPHVGQSLLKSVISPPISKGFWTRSWFC